MVSSIATFSWSSLRLRENIRFEAIVVVVLLGGGLISAPWHTATALCLLYLLAMPFSIGSYIRVRRLRASAHASLRLADDHGPLQPDGNAPRMTSIHQSPVGLPLPP